jgi:predicted metalloprotease with PDZ domain
VLVARRGQLLKLEVTLGDEPRETWKLKIRPDATPEQTANLEAWLGAKEPAPSGSETAEAAAGESPES